MRHQARAMPFDELVDGLSRQVADGTVAVVKNGDLSLFKYTQACVYEKRWNRFSLMARGLIVDLAARRVVATPFQKFFNYGEGQIPGQPMAPLPDEPFEVTDKVDGSLGIVYWHAGAWRVATRGSFQSAQAQWAEAHLGSACATDALRRGTTYLVEIVYPENRIVVSYGYRGLVLLSAYDAEGYEQERWWLERAAAHAGFRLVPARQFGNLDDLLAVAKELSCDEEGFVVRFLRSGLRLKVKGDEYCRVHRLVSRVTPLAVWEMLAAGDDPQAVAVQLPEEFKRDFDTIWQLLSDGLVALIDRVKVAADSTAHMDDKALGLWLRDQATFKDDVARWIFPARKKDFLTRVHEPGGAMRRRACETFRPTANRLNGYVPSTAMNRFQEEAI